MLDFTPVGNDLVDVLYGCEDGRWALVVFSNEVDQVDFENAVSDLGAIKPLK